MQHSSLQKLNMAHCYTLTLGLGKSVFDCDIPYFLFIKCTGAFTFLNQYRICLVLTFFSAQFDIPYSILFVQVTLSHFSKFYDRRCVITLFLLMNFFCAKKQKKIYSKVASHYVRKLPHECDDITKNAWCTPLNAQCNIDYNILYSLLF